VVEGVHEGLDSYAVVNKTSRFDRWVLSPPGGPN
jgi:hypothetical protein